MGSLLAKVACQESLTYGSNQLALVSYCTQSLAEGSLWEVSFQYEHWGGSRVQRLSLFFTCVPHSKRSERHVFMWSHLASEVMHILLLCTGYKQMINLPMSNGRGHRPHLSKGRESKIFLPLFKITAAAI